MYSQRGYMLVRYSRYFRTGYLPIQQSSIVFFGCSFMWGESVNYTESVAYLVQKATGIHCQNFAVPGAGPQLVREIMDQLDLSRARAVVIAWPGVLREHYWRADQLLCYGPWVGQTHRLSKYTEEYARYHQRLASGSVLAANHRARDCGISQPTLAFDFRQFAQGFSDLGRDGSHPGPRTQARVAQRVLAWLKFNRLTAV